MTENAGATDDPRLGKILYTFEPPSLWQMVAGLIGAALGWLLISVWGPFLLKVTLTLVALGSVAFLIGLWRYSEQVQFGALGVRRHKWGGARELLYPEIAVLTHLGSEDELKYSQLRLEPLPETGQGSLQFYRFEVESFAQAEWLLVSAMVDEMQRRLARGQAIEWLPGVVFRRDGLELTQGAAGANQTAVVPYREIGGWQQGERGACLLTRRKTGDVLLSATLDTPNFFPCRQLLVRLADAGTPEPSRAQRAPIARPSV